MKYETGSEWQTFSQFDGTIRINTILEISTCGGYAAYKTDRPEDTQPHYTCKLEQITDAINNFDLNREKWEHRQRELAKKADRDSKAAIKRTTVEKYLATLAPMQAGKARKTLDKMYNFTNIGALTRFEIIEKLARDGAGYSGEHTETLKPTREEKWSGDRRTRKTWDLGGYDDTTITKTGLKYFEWLKENT